MEEIKINYILDTNIVIYISQNNQKIQDFISGLEGDVGISAITYIEFLMGVEPSSINEGRNFLGNFEFVSLDIEISFLVQKILKISNSKNIKHTQFPDIVIGSTAEVLGIPLITNNPKDFAIFKNIEIISVK